MSGLAALINRDGRPVDESLLREMLSVIDYRGPDGEGLTVMGPVGLGQVKLATTFEDEREQQPIVSRAGGIVLIADVRLDNREELLGMLAVPKEASDAQLMLRAYERWDENFAKILIGDFAFALWDPRRRLLLAGRDTSGQRTLYYRVTPRCVALASEIHQLFCDPTAQVRPNEERIKEYLVPLNHFRNQKDSALTFFEGIHALEAGHLLSVEQERVVQRRYWTLVPGKEIRYRRDEDYADHFRELFAQVLRGRLRSSRPLGALLSGGLDSSTVVCMAQELYRSGKATSHGFSTYSYVYDGLACDERPLIELIAAKYDLDAHYFPVAEYQQGLELDPRGFRAGPGFGNPDSISAVFATAARSGVRGILTGDWADSIVGGSPQVFDSLLRQGQFGAFRRHLRTYRSVYRGETLRRLLVSEIVGPVLPLPIQRALTALVVRREIKRSKGRLLPSWMSVGLRADLERRHLDLSVRDALARVYSNPSREADVRLLYPPEACAAPTVPIEIRRPFSDRRLHAFMLAIPPEQRYELLPGREFYAGSKWLVRRAMAGIIPDQIRNRSSKTTFVSAVQHEVDRGWATFAAAFGPDSHPEVVRRGYVDHQAFWSRLQGLRQDEIGLDMVYVAAVAGLEVWLRSLSQPRSALSRVAPPRSRVTTAQAGWPHPAAAATHASAPMQWRTLVGKEVSN